MCGTAFATPPSPGILATNYVAFALNKKVDKRILPKVLGSDLCPVVIELF
jgi:hypothetical protein